MQEVNSVRFDIRTRNAIACAVAHVDDVQVGRCEHDRFRLDRMPNPGAD